MNWLTAAQIYNKGWIKWWWGRINAIFHKKFKFVIIKRAPPLSSQNQFRIVHWHCQKSLGVKSHGGSRHSGRWGPSRDSLLQLPKSGLATSCLPESLANECIVLATEINDYIPQLPSDLRKAAYTLSQTVTEIRQDIEGLNQPSFLIKFTTVLRLRGKTVERCLISL